MTTTHTIQPNDDGLSGDEYVRLLARLDEVLTAEKPSDLVW